MYDLRVVVEEVRGFCDMPMKPGDYFELKGGRLYIPAGGFMCMWALQSLLPMLPLTQRDSAEVNDWVPTTHRMMCPDPNGMVVYRIDRIGVDAGVNGSTESIPSRLLVNEHVCSGCRACELACSFHHESVFAPELARLQVEKVEADGIDRPKVCHQCGNAACMSACNSGALSRDPITRAVIVDAEICTGCGACARACTFGVIRLRRGAGGPGGNKPDSTAPLICDLCGGDPACVKRCVTGALTFGRAGDHQKKR